MLKEKLRHRESRTRLMLSISTLPSVDYRP
jgi:hypothetical protein